jgi:hypothetical protein
MGPRPTIGGQRRRRTGGDFTVNEVALKLNITTLDFGVPLPRGRGNMPNYDELMQLARMCLQQARETISPIVSAELRRRAKEYQNRAAELDNGKGFRASAKTDLAPADLIGPRSRARRRSRSPATFSRPRRAPPRSPAISSTSAKGAGETGSASSQVLSSAQALSAEGNKLRVEVDKFPGSGTCRLTDGRAPARSRGGLSRLGYCAAYCSNRQTKAIRHGILTEFRMEPSNLVRCPPCIRGTPSTSFVTS